MAINTNVPLASQTLADTQNPIRQNFIDINNDFAVNHGEYNSANKGKHIFLTFPVQAASPAIVYPDIGLFSKLYATTGINELFFINSGNVVPEVPITASAYQANGFAYLPSGILMKWGTSGVNDNTTNNIPLTSGGTPNFTLIFNIQITLATIASGNPGTAVSRVSAYPYDPTLAAPPQTFPVQTNGLGSPRAITWFAIGY